MNADGMNMGYVLYGLATFVMENGLPGRRCIDMSGLDEYYDKVGENFKCQNMLCNAMSWGSK